MIVWINGAFGVGKTTVATEIHMNRTNSHIYDPENMGQFINENIPDELKVDDFQDYSIWRFLNYSSIKYLHGSYDGDIIVPMTITDKLYFNEIISFLRNDGIVVRHFTLIADRDTLIQRLKNRGDSIDSWAVKQIDRCIHSYSSEAFSEYIDTEGIEAKSIAAQIIALL